MKHRILFSILLLLLLTLCLSACGRNAAPAQAPSPSPEASPTPSPTPKPTPTPVETIPLGADTVVNADVEELTLKDGAFAPDALLEALPRLTKLKRLTLVDTALGAGQLIALKDALGEEAKFAWSTKIGSLRLDSEAERLDLSKLKRSELRKVLAAAPLLKQVKAVELMDKNGESPFPKADVRRVMRALPDCEIHYEFTLFDKRLSTLDEVVEYDHVRVADEDEQQLREALELLPRCRRFLLDLDARGIQNERMAAIRADYPTANVAWRVFLTTDLSVLTDEEIMRLNYTVTDRNCRLLEYCDRVVYLDLGHCEMLSDVGFLANMPRLECLILSGSCVSDLSALESCPRLTWLELCFCSYVSDLNVLRDHQSLKYLNLSYTGVNDLHALEKVPLERFVAFHCPISPEQQELFVQAHPECLAAFWGEQPYGYPWRYNEGGQGSANFFPYYRRMRELFLYDRESAYNRKTELYDLYGPGYLVLRPYNLVYDENLRPRQTTPYQELKAAGRCVDPFSAN